MHVRASADQNATSGEEMSHLALLGVVTIGLLLQVIMTKRMSPLIALILIPLFANLAGGFGWDTSKFVVGELQSLEPVVSMFVFAILFFSVVTDAGMLDPIIDRILRTVGTRPGFGFAK
jgi:CitMHS family citrate-Mg2+:H+ or citrate-Ca2+:H+ symporter